MKKLIFDIVVVLFVFGLGGCSYHNNIINQDFPEVVYDDGITAEESQSIAQQNLFDAGQLEYFHVEKPKMFEPPISLINHDQYWFVTFPQKGKYSLTTVYLVAVDKQSGEVVFARSYYPKNEWVLEAAFLRHFETK